MPSHAQPVTPAPVSTSSSRSRSSIAALLLLLTAVFGSLLVSTAGSADASTTGAAAVQEASRHHGQPYQYGAAGPTRFDCSGFTLYVWGRFGRHLAHNTNSQWNEVRHIANSNKQPGDLIFFRSSSGGFYHVGIYAGSGKMWHAPKSGDVVRLAAIYSSNYAVGRP